MDIKKTKETHPQWYYLKIICKLIYYMGIGDCWYKETKRSRTHKVLYGIWAIFINGYIILETCNEVLANFRTDLNGKEKNDLLQFSFAHPSLCAKYIFLILQRERVRVLFKRMVGEERMFISLDIEKKSVKKAMLYSFSLAAVTYATVFLTAVDALRASLKDEKPSVKKVILYSLSLAAVTYTTLAISAFDALRTSIKEGTSFRTEVHLWPSPSYSGIFSGFLYFLRECHWWVIVTNMILVDGLSFFSLIYLGYKFKLIGEYFDMLREKTISNADGKNKKVLAQEFKKDFVLGIKMHEDALWCARNVQYSLGNIYGVEIIETTTVLALCLIKLVDSGRNLMFLLANLLYIGCMMVINGAYMTAAGDVTYLASEMSLSLFNSGWELVPRSPGFRSLIIVALQRSQMPVVMTAFGVITLSHSNFISVIRASYSFFAVMY